MATTKRKRVTTYNRRGWWPDGWSVEPRGKGHVVMNKDTGEVLYTGQAEMVDGEELYGTEIDCMIWADCNGR